MKQVTSKKLIEMLGKKNINISKEQATEVLKLIRFLADAVVENYLREIKNSKISDKESENTRESDT